MAKYEEMGDNIARRSRVGAICCKVVTETRQGERKRQVERNGRGWKREMVKEKGKEKGKAPLKDAF